MKITRSLQEHWPEYLAEAWGLGTFMVVACLAATALEHPASPARAAIGDGDVRRVLMGLAMGVTAIAIITSPWGKRSGAHLNPAVTLTFLRLGKVGLVDAAFYVAAQIAGGLAGVGFAYVVLGNALADGSVRFIATTPGGAGVHSALVAEFAMAGTLMLAVLVLSNHPRLARWTPVAAGLLVCLFIVVGAPYSGMSINPARSLASALPSGIFDHFWIYIAGPMLGMLGAAEAYVRVRGAHHVFCAKLDHRGSAHCLFRCRYNDLLAQAAQPAATSPGGTFHEQ